MQKTADYRLKSCPFCGNQAKLVKTWDGLHRAECSRCACRTADYPTMIAAARRWNQRKITKSSGWIDCDVHLPENSAPCLTVCRTWSMTENAWKEGTLMILRYLPKENRWNTSGMADVTHWMPMPELPETEGDIYD